MQHTKYHLTFDSEEGNASEGISPLLSGLHHTTELQQDIFRSAYTTAASDIIKRCLFPELDRIIIKWI